MLAKLKVMKFAHVTWGTLYYLEKYPDASSKDIRYYTEPSLQ
jgi:hypothetical protein